VNNKRGREGRRERERERERETGLGHNMVRTHILQKWKYIFFAVHTSSSFHSSDHYGHTRI
jgi:hypothetical protein